MVLFLISIANINAQSLSASGDAAYGASNFKDAISYYQRAELEESNNLDLALKLANCYYFTNDLQKAAKIYERLNNNPSPKADVYFYYAKTLMGIGDYDKAISVIEKFTPFNPSLTKQIKESCEFAKKYATTPAAFLVNKEAISLNSSDDYAPLLHKNELIFTSSRKIELAPNQYSDGMSSNYLYRSTIGSEGQLSQAALIKNPLNGTSTQSNISPMALITNESRGITSYNYFNNGIRHIRNAGLNKLSMELIMNMTNIEDFPPGATFPHVGDNTASFPFFANNGNTIYFAADGLPNGYGGFDLWVIHFQNGIWTAPQNLGPNVNTPGDEICPHIANNGYLFFASDYHKGLGGFDIFRATKVANTWKDVRNLGNQVNSSYDDFYFVFDASSRRGYFSSNRTGTNYDIYSALMKGDENLMPLVNASEHNIVVVDPVTNTTTTNNGSTAIKTETGGYKVDNKTTTTTNNTTNNNTNNTANNTTEPPLDGYGTTNPNVNTTTGTTTTKPTTNNNTTTTKPTTPNNNIASSSTIENVIPCAMNFYIGGILDAETKRPLDGAVIYIKNQKTGVENQIKAPTNVYGEYSIILDPLTDYSIAVSKSGYKNLVFDINTGTGGKKTLLGTRPMYASPMLERDVYGNVIQGNGPIVTTNPSQEELLNPVRSSGKTFSYEANGMPMPKEGYLIQALVATKLTEEERLELGKYGNIITEARGNKTAYRVGIFVDPNQLENALTAIKATYRDAFKVPVELNNNDLAGRLALSSQVVYPIPTPKPQTVLEDKKVVIAETPITNETNYDSWATNKDIANNPDFTPRGGTTASEPVVAFKIQLGAFKEADNISFSHISHLGKIEKTKKQNGLTYFYLSNFRTIEDARLARSKAQEGGVASPFIVAFKNGVQVNISDVVKN